MLALTALFTLVGALGVAASPSHLAIRAALPRQLTDSTIPAACQAQCTSTLTIYNACTASPIDQTTCLTVCNPDTFNELTGCFSCVLVETPGVSQSVYSQLQSAVGSLQSACAATGQSVTGQLTPFESLTAAASATASDAGPVTSDSDVSFTSGASGITIGAGGSATASGAAATSRTSALPIGGASASASASGLASTLAGAASSAASGASSAASAASSAAASAAPSSGAMLGFKIMGQGQGLGGMGALLVLVGAGAGLGLVL